MNDKNDFYLSKTEPNKSCFLALRSIILNLEAEIKESIKYGMPCFSYHNKIICYLWKDKKTEEPYILMVDGNLLNHPKLETGKRAKMKILRVNPNKDLAVKVIKTVLIQALSLYKKDT